METFELDPKGVTEEILEPVKDVPVNNVVGLGAMALTLAMKYHDIATVKDGALYQQYKLEGRNLVPFHLDMVFETAMRIEEHLMNTESRLATYAIRDISQGVADRLLDAFSDESDAPEEPDGLTRADGSAS